MDNFGDLIKTFIYMYLVYVVIFSFVFTSISYLTYRFWKFLLKKEESDIFVTNAAMFGKSDKNENIIKEKIQGMIVEAVQDYMINNK